MIVLLQAGQKQEALSRAVLIRCEHMRSEAVKLVERSRPFPRSTVLRESGVLQLLPSGATPN